MSELNVECRPAAGGWSCRVTVSEGGSRTGHEVTVSRAELDRLAPNGQPERLVEASFGYLLEREPKESILRKFAISEIGRYFPGYPREIAGRL